MNNMLFFSSAFVFIFVFLLIVLYHSIKNITSILRYSFQVYVFHDFDIILSNLSK